MPQVIFAPRALLDLQRLREFLRRKSPTSAKRAAIAIIYAVQRLALHPEMGRQAEEMAASYRVLPVAFGDSGYLVLYRHANDLVTVLAVRHQKEAGF